MKVKLCFLALTSLLILMTIPLISHGQEPQDSLNIRLKPEQFNQQLPIVSSYIIESLEIPSFEDRMFSYIFMPQLSNEFPAYYQEMVWGYQPVGHQFLGSSFNFMSQNRYTMLGFNIQLQQIMGWEKLNIYGFGNGMLFYDHQLNGNILQPGTQRGVGVNLGFGFEYEIKPGTKVFYEQTHHLKNISPFGKTQTGGVRLEF